MKQLKWYKDYSSDYDKLINHIKTAQPQVVAIDTETTGLNIVNDIPFLIIVAFWNNVDYGYSYVLDFDKQQVPLLLDTIATTANFIVGANIKYDLHMLANWNCPFPFDKLKSNAALTDIQILRRLTNTVDNDEKLSLKYLAKKLIDETADEEEVQVKYLKKQIDDRYRKILNTALKPFNYSLAKIKKDLANYEVGLDNLPPDVKEIYNHWLAKYGEANYYHIYLENRQLMLDYAVNDGIITIELFYNLYNKLIQLIQVHPEVERIFNNENHLIKIYYEQERLGFNVDIEYLKQSKVRLTQYINKLTKKLHTLLQEPVSANQHKELIRIFIERFKVSPEKLMDNNKLSFNKAVIRRLKQEEGVVKETCLVIEKLRQAIKWLETYVETMLQEALENNDNRLHPQSHQNGTVSGRISSKYQQIPKEALYDDEGVEIYHPRKAIIPSKNGYSCLVFQDFDQMELRVQADYTILFNCLDENMCSMFVPYNHTYNGKLYDVNDSWCKANYAIKDENDNSVWLSNNQPWKEIDPHGLLVKNAFHIDESHPDWKHYRAAAKTINFAMTYGSGLKNLLENPSLEDYSSDIITTIFNTYKTSYKGIVQYQQQVINYIKANGAIKNRYGRVYAFSDNNYGYKAANYLIQGTCADLVKHCLVKMDAFLKANKLKSRILFTIHDEIVWELYDGEDWLIEQFKTIIQQESSWSKIPLTCGTDISFTNWAEKKDISEINKE